MERILAILSPENEYARELASYLSSKEDFIFKPVVFDNAESYLRYEKEHQVDMLLCEEAFFSDKSNSFAARNVVKLTEYIMVEEDEGDCDGVIFKFQSSEQIMREIIDYYSRSKGSAHEREVPLDSGGGDILTDTGPNTFCICSPFGGSHCSTYALALAQYYSRYGQTLFVSFDPFFLLPGETKKYADKNLTDIIYFLQIYEQNPISFIKKIAMRNGSFSYISGVSHWFDIADITIEQMRRFFAAVCDEGGYETIVFDLGAIGSAGIEILAGCKNVYVPKRPGKQYRAVMSEWKRQLSFSGQNDIIEKVIEREVPTDPALEDDYTFESLLSGALGFYIAETEGDADAVGKYAKGIAKSYS